MNPINSPKNQAAEYFKKLAEEGTKGRVKIEIYPSSTLYKDKEELEALQIGAVQMLAPTLGKFGPMGLRDFEVFDLPYLFDSFEQVHLVTQGPIGQQLLGELDAKGVKGLAFWDNGFKQMSANRPLKKVDDFKGLKMRIFSSKVLDAEMRSLGAQPQVLAGQRDLHLDAERPRRRRREHRINLLPVQDVRGAEVHDAVEPRLRRLRGGREQEVLGRPAAGHPRRAGRRDREGHRIRQSHHEEGKRGRPRRHQGHRQDPGFTLSKAEKDEWKKVMVKSHDAADRINKDMLKAIYKATGAQ